MSLGRLLRVGVLASLVAASARVGAAGLRVARPVDNCGGLRMRLFRTGGRASAPAFRLVLENVGGQGIVLPIGMEQGGGRQQYLTGFRYLLRQPSGEVVRLSPDQPASVFGQPPDPLEISLGPGVAISLPVDLATYRMPQVRPDWRVHLAPGHYTIWVELEHRMAIPGISGTCVLPVPMVPYVLGGEFADRAAELGGAPVRVRVRWLKPVSLALLMARLKPGPDETRSPG